MGTESEVLGVLADWDAALVANDAAAVEGFMADDWVYVGPAGPTPKADLVDWIESGRLAHHTMVVVGQPRVMAYGDTAIVTARKQSSGTWDGVPYTADEWISELFVRRHGRWTCVLSHKTAAEG